MGLVYRVSFILVPYRECKEVRPLPNMSFRVKGDRELRSALRRLGPRAETALSGALYREGETIMNRSKRLTPVDTGTLRSTGHVQRPRKRGGVITVTLGFGGPAARYAAIVHEMTEANFTVGQAKYLQEPFENAVEGLTQRLAREVRRSIGRRS